MIDAVHARGSGEAARRAKRERQPEKKKESLSVSAPLPSRAVSHACGHLLVSRLARRTTEKRETARSLKNENVINCNCNCSYARASTLPSSDAQTSKQKNLLKNVKFVQKGLKFFKGKLADSGFVLQKLLKFVDFFIPLAKDEQESRGP